MPERRTVNLIYRPFDLRHDLAALVQLFEESEQIEPTGEIIDEETLRKQLTWSGKDPALSIQVVTAPDSPSLIGYGQIQKALSDPNTDLQVLVHPAWRRKGIGSQIFARLLDQATALGSQALRAYTTPQNQGADLFARAQGFTPVSTYTRLSVEGKQSFPEPALPEGFTIRNYAQVRSVDLYTEAMNLGYEGQWGHLHCTPEEAKQILASLDHAGILLLFSPDGKIAGVCNVELNKDLSRVRGVPTALINAPGIVPTYRNAEFSLLLLLAAIRLVHPLHPAILELEAWGEVPETLTRYRSLGFQVIKEEISYRKAILHNTLPDAQ